MNKSCAVKKGDLVVIMLVLLCAAAGWAWTQWEPGAATADLAAEIYLDGQYQQSITLTGETRELRLTGAVGYNLLQIGPQGVCIVEADCPNQDCVRAGLQSRSGVALACLPHRLLIRLSGAKEAGFDAIAH